MSQLSENFVSRQTWSPNSSYPYNELSSATTHCLKKNRNLAMKISRENKVDYNQALILTNKHSIEICFKSRHLYSLLNF